MPDTEEQILAKLAALQAVRDAGESVYFAEIVRVEFGAPDGAKDFCFTQIDRAPGFRGVVLTEMNFAPEAKMVTSKGQPFIKLPKTAAFKDDKATVEFSDLDGEMTRLCRVHGQGLRAHVYNYYPQVGLTLEEWTGTLGAPKEANGRTLKLEIVSGFRSPNLLIPNRLPVVSCPFIFGAHLASQQEIDEHKGCPYNAHLSAEERGGAPLVGVPGFTDCPRATVGDCSARLVTTRFFPGYLTAPESILNRQTEGPNLLAANVGNENALSDPIPMYYGTWKARGLRLLAFRPENNNNHPEQGFVAAVFEIGEGPLGSISNCRINGVFVGFQHLNVRSGQLGQPPTGFSPNVGSYSGTAHFFGRIQGDFRNVTASSLTGSCDVNQGQADIRVYSDEGTYAEQWTDNAAYCIADMLTRKRSAYGEDYDRYSIPSLIDAADWCDGTTTFRDGNGNAFTARRGAFSAKLAPRSTQQQIYDACVAARLAVPFHFAGKKHFRPLRTETIDGSIPAFHSRGRDANIAADKGRAIFEWSYTGDDELVNEVVVTFADETNGHVETKITVSDQRQQLKAGRAWGDRSVRKISKTYPALGITNPAAAARLANLLLYLGPLDAGGIRNNLEVKFTTWFSQCLRLRPYDLVRLVIPEIAGFGFDYFRAVKIERLSDLKVKIEARAYPVEYYEQIEGEAGVDLVGEGHGPNPGGGLLDRPRPVTYEDVLYTRDRVSFRLAPLGV